jgi:hypothetical protein
VLGTLTKKSLKFCLSGGAKIDVFQNTSGPDISPAVRELTTAALDSSLVRPDVPVDILQRVCHK